MSGFVGYEFVFGGQEFFYEVVDIARECGRNVAARIADAVVGDAVLGKIVGTDFFAAVTRADEVTSVGAELGVFFIDFGLEQAGAQDTHSFVFIFGLGFFVLVGDDQAGRQVGDAHGRVGGVNALAAVATAAKHVDFEVAGVDFDVGFFGLRQDGHGDRAGMDAALAFGDGHTLDAVDAGFELEVLISFIAANHKDNFFETTGVARAF